MTDDHLLNSRQSWIDLGDQMVVAATKYFSSDRAMIHAPGPTSRHGRDSDGVEGFARVLLLRAFVDAGRNSLAGDVEDFLGGIAKGVTGPSRSWPTAAENRHVVVDAASVATALWLQKHRLWNELSDETRTGLAAWLSDCAEASRSSPNNWRLFGAIVAGFLTSVGLDAHRALMLDSLSATNEMYRGGGWYTDGPGRAFDYYNSFTFHYYAPLLTHLLGADDATVRERSAQFVADLRLLFAADGSHVRFGRSQTYRFAVSSAFSTAALIGAAQDPADLRVLTESNVRHFIDRGALTDGILLRGWHQGSSIIPESYSGPLASYWVGKVFSNLLLPQDHPYWSGVAGQGHPGARVQALRVPGFLVAASDGREVVRLANHGSYDRVATDVRLDTDDPYYSRLSYSSASAVASLSDARDSSFTVRSRGRTWGRARIIPLMAGEDWATSRTYLRADRSRTLRAVLVRLRRSRLSRFVPTDLLHRRADMATLSHGSWDVQVFMPPRSLFGARASVVFAGWRVPAPEQSTTAHSARAWSAEWCSEVLGLLGFDSASVDRVDTVDGLPVVRGPLRRGRLWVAATALYPSGSSVETVPRVVASAPRHLTIQWADGHVHRVSATASGLQVRAP